MDLSLTIVDLFRKQARATPDAPAVLFDGKTISYKELDAYTDALAAKILSYGLGEEDVVSVLINRNAWMTKASLATMKAGCAYQPLDPSYPTERLNFMIQDSGAKLLIADKELHCRPRSAIPSRRTCTSCCTLPAPPARPRALCWNTATW